MLFAAVLVCGWLVVGAAASPSRRAVAISAGDGETCAVLSNGTVACWGYNAGGSNIPVVVKGVRHAVQVSPGRSSCAVLAGGAIKCWGADDQGQLGNGKKVVARALPPVTVKGISNAKEVNVNGDVACAVLRSGAIKCWGGSVSDGVELGPPSAASGSVTPVVVPGISNAREVSVGALSSCALLADGTVKCWGSNTHWALGNGLPIDAASTTAVTVQGISGASAMTTTVEGGCALIANGSVSCWGLPDSLKSDNGLPVVVRGISKAKALSSNHAYSQCALLANGTIKCWGNGSDGVLGDGRVHFTGDMIPPVTVRGIGNAKAVSIGGQTGAGPSACALLTGGTVKCWGSNYQGALGNGTNPNTVPLSLKPVTVKGL